MKIIELLESESNQQSVDDKFNPWISKIMKIKGMTCEHCVNNVTNAINKVPGASAKVSLKDNEAIISYDRELSNIELRNAVEEAGYKVVSLS